MMRRRGIHIIGLILFLSSLSLHLIGQTFPCGEEGLYLIMSPSISKNSELYRLRIDTANQLSSYELIGKLDRQIDAAGHSVADGLIYGIDRGSKELIRIYPNAQTENLGLPLYLDTTLQYFAGTIGPYGRRLFVIGRDPFTQHDEQLFRIDLFKPDFVTGSSTLHSNAYAQIDDFAYDPLYGSIFGFNGLDQRLVQISGGQVNDFNFLNTNQSSGMGSILFDGEAQLYGYGASNGGSSEGNLFTINKFNGKVDKYDGGPGQAWTDACACPYFVKFEKLISPQNVLPCGEVRIVYRFRNHGGSAFSLESLVDTLSPYLTITDIEPVAFSYDTIIGLGGHILQIDRPSLYIGNDSIVLWASVDPQATGDYQSQAHLSKLPLMLGGDRVSDDPTTLLEDDPSFIRFTSQGDLSLQSQASVLCYEDTIVLKAPGGGARYLWSDGTTAQKLSVTQGGTYWLEMENACGVFRDTLFINGRNAPITLDLGENREIEPGDSLLLNPSIVGAIGGLQYQWRVQPESRLSCRQCPNPYLQAQQDSRIYLRVQDEDGCEASDSLAIRLAKIRKIFVPSAFSPNADMYNDLFYIQGFGEVEIVSMRVFNRWGNLVFVREGGTINDTRHSWDGNSQGRAVAPGVYVWTAQLRFPDGEVETFSGSLTLIR